MNYYVSVHTYHPYKIESSFTEKGSDYAVAIRRAITKFKKLPNISGKRLEQVWATARRV